MNAPNKLERATRFEPATFSLARRRSTTELCPQRLIYDTCLCPGGVKSAYFSHQ